VPKQEADASVSHEHGDHKKNRKYWAWAKLIAKVFDIELGKQAVLLPPTPLGTGLDSFPSSGSSLSKAVMCV